MPFKTFTAGSVFTAADANAYFMNQAVATFTTEAARDAAITSPTEGMIAYLTAPTVPAATGDATAVPTGVRTIYNGTVWVCVTPIGANTTATGTTTSTSYTATLSGSPGTNPTVTIVTGTTALVSAYASGSNAGTNSSYMSVAVSGAGTVAASDSYGFFTGASATNRNGMTWIITGLTAGTNTFTLQYRVAGNTLTIANRTLVVEGIA